MRVGIVNDLAVARETLRRVVTAVPGYVVAWTADDGDEAVSKTLCDRPDVVLMDLVMPRLNGVEATRQIMQRSPCPVLVVTASVSNHFPLVFQALGAGAVDAVDTPTLNPNGAVQNASKLVERLAKLEAALAGLTGSAIMPLAGTSSHPADLPPLVLLGASTGGPEALAQVVSAFPADFGAGVLISQHIGADFAHGLVQQLAAWCRLPVRAAQEGELVRAGTVYVAATDDHLELGADRTLRYTPNPKSSPYRPSVDVLFTSAVNNASRPGVAALLTGMGHDGAAGLLKLRAAGWHTVAQNESTCVVYGMPKAAAEKRAAVEVLALQHIGASIVVKVNAFKRRSHAGVPATDSGA
ncbi:chemotaxis-specific protein-glutamate methyltransferase CheB [Gemmata sp. JC717]|uniref:Protein-glutamate methylesterase/protein-glutamine glutaminase n=1 Tax=Gemmata algarum TaxID=2975278 RepID=A0ABU5F4Q6_9BACT|nr:chemotaxis-specific protein-glutamate methyltransferase CheB [Gemmata algarum]MDY3551714.1 chemotaxis-specific protein-glutamate methyltransferase CheB [Gemmata algarum]MDY3561737.1 chemotaxis-specific protein-glutamate methyltransferase CheB [Gemmata algarum]